MSKEIRRKGDKKVALSLTLAHMVLIRPEATSDHPCNLGDAYARGIFLVTHVAKVAVLIDGGFFLKRFPTAFPEIDGHDAELVSQRIGWLVGNHLEYLNRISLLQNKWGLLYRAFYYDARPYVNQAVHPISHKPLNYARSPEALFRLELFDRLRRMPYTAVRLGEVRKDSDRSWILKAKAQADLLSGAKEVASLSDNDFSPALRQKGVDMRIGVDMSSLSLKGLVDTIVLVTGDADFIPAAKLARREGVRVILDPLWQNVDKNLFEHIDGVFSGVPRPLAKIVAATEGTPNKGNQQ